MQKETGWSHICYLKNFVLPQFSLFFWWQGCSSLSKWHCSSACYKNSEVIYPLRAIIGRENGSGREEYAFFQGSGTWVTASAACGVQECFCSRTYKHKIHDSVFPRLEKLVTSPGKKLSSWTNTMAGIEGTEGSQAWWRDCWGYLRLLKNLKKNQF